MELLDLLGEDLLSFCSESSDEFEIDQLFLSAFELCDREQSVVSPAPGSPTRPYQQAKPTVDSPTPGFKERFAKPKTEGEIQEARLKGVPKKTLDDTRYCMSVWDAWCNYRQKTCGDNIPPLIEQQSSQQQHWLTRFVLEVRKQDGSEYPPDSLHHLCCGIMRFLRWNGFPGIDIFKGSDFADFRATLDAEMKRLQSLGLGSKKKQAETLKELEEETLWKKGLLGDSTPQVLLDTMVFMNGLYFALRSGNEHRALRFSPSQIEVVEREGERPYLLYTEDISKNHPGGLKGRRIKPKVVRHHANIQNPTRCFVRLYKLYMSLCPSDRPHDAFYLQPLRKPTPECWYSRQPLGHNKLAQTVARLCKQAGIKGYKTNHSLRATNATRLYTSGADEQLIMERTGHRSIDGVRTYKRTSNEQQVILSDVLNNTKRPRVEEVQLMQSSPRPAPLPHLTSTGQLPVLRPSGPETSSSSVTPGQVSSRAAFTSMPGGFHINACSSVTVNFNVNN